MKKLVIYSYLFLLIAPVIMLSAMLSDIVKMMNNKRYSALFFFLLFFTCSLNGQVSNSYKFIEPNISVSYDSNYFKTTQYYSNEFYEVEACDFKYQIDKKYKVTIHVKANHADKLSSIGISEDKLLYGIKELKAIENDSFKIVRIDESPKHVHGFSLVGFVLYDKFNRQYETMIKGFRYSDSEKTEIKYSSINRNDLEKEYQILATFLSQFKAYSKQDIEKEDAEIKSKYSVFVNPTKMVLDKFKNRPKTYLGIVSVKQHLNHTISKVLLNSTIGQEVFTPNKKGETAILCFDNQKGVILKTGILIILNSFGKRVKVPLSFSYINKGQL